MNFNDYQEQAAETALPTAYDLNYAFSGLAGEAGELVGLWAKAIRDDGFITTTRMHQVSKELGDVLWFCAHLATMLDLSLEDIALQNLEKLRSRQERGVISGSGDDR